MVGDRPVELAVLVGVQFGRAAFVAAEQFAGDDGADGAGIAVGGGGRAQGGRVPAYRQACVGEGRVAGRQVQRFGVEQYAVEAEEDHVYAHIVPSKFDLSH